MPYHVGKSLYSIKKVRLHMSVKVAIAFSQILKYEVEK